MKRLEPPIPPKGPEPIDSTGVEAGTFKLVIHTLNENGYDALYADTRSGEHSFKRSLIVNSGDIK